MEEMTANWSSWKYIDKLSGHDSHAVYEVCLVTEEGAHVAIDRFLDEDKKGVLCIGMTTNMERRRKQFISGESEGYCHSEGNLLFLLKKYSRFKKNIVCPSISIAFRM